MASMPAGILILVCWVSLGVYWNISARSIKSAAKQQNLAARLARMPVWVGFVLFVAAWVHPFGPVAIRRTVLSDSVGVSICVLGLLVAIWSRKVLGAEWSRDVELKQGHKVVERGPYRLMRHPIYTGHLLMGLETAIASGSPCRVCWTSIVRGRVLDKAEPGGTPASATVSRVASTHAKAYFRQKIDLEVLQPILIGDVKE